MGIIDEVKAVAKTVQQIDNIELYSQILDLQAEIMELVEENHSLKRQISQLEEEAQIHGDLIVRDDCYWTPREGKDPDGPFCTNCWDLKRKLVRMSRSLDPEYSECINCEKAMRVHRSD